MPALGLRGRPGIPAPRSLAGRPGSAPQRGTNPPRVLSDEPQAFCQGRAQHTGRVPRRISEGGRDETPPTPAATLPHRPRLSLWPLEPDWPGARPASTPCELCGLRLLKCLPFPVCKWDNGSPYVMGGLFLMRR